MKQSNNLENEAEFLGTLNREVGALMDVEIPAPDPDQETRRSRRDALRSGVQINKKALAWIITISIVLVIVGGGFAAYFAIREHGRVTLTEHVTLDALRDVEFTPPESAIVADGEDTLNWNGKTYKKKDSVINILCLGVDKKTIDPDPDEIEIYGEAGQADTIFLAALDTKTGKLTLLNISRDTMADVDVYNTDGEYTETRPMQICLGYAYGDGGESSSLNMCKAVSGLMYGIPVDGYGAIKLPAVSILNDAIGGVEVTVLEDLTKWDPSLTEGASVLLKGNLARTYVQARGNELNSNSQRMARQRQYVTAFLQKAFQMVRSDWSIAVKLYQTVKAYTHTSLGLSQIVYLVSLAANVDFSQDNIITIPGELVRGESYAEFYPDDDAVFQIIMDTYYQEVP